MQQLIRMMLLFWAISFSVIGYGQVRFHGEISKIPISVQKVMSDGTWRENCPVSLNDLSYLKVSYWGFDHKIHYGEIIVNQKVAREVLDIFKQLFAAHYLIQKVELPEKLASSQKFSKPFDLLLYAVNANDTYGFFCREDTQTPGKFSVHSWGLAIDINPFYNPMAGDETVAKLQKGNLYLNRKLRHVGMIRAGDLIFNMFTNHGWQWGGFFEKGADYMHFEKVFRPYYMAQRLEYIPKSEEIPNLQLLK